MRPEARFAYGVGAGLVAGFACALALGFAGDGILGSDEDPVDQARTVIEDNYFEEVESEDLDRASIRGIVSELRTRYDDRFSHYFSPKQLEVFEQSTSGRFSGVGLTVSEVPRGLRVAAVIPDTPAEAAGIGEGDVITAVDGKSIAGLSADVSSGLIKGPPGTDVELRVAPATGADPEVLTVERASVRLPAVQGRLRRTPDGTQVAHVSFRSFSRGAHGELRDEVERVLREGAQGLVIDLRGNGGGLLNEAILSASVFVEDGVVASTRSRAHGETEYEAVGDALAPRPTVVLANRDTASASEIVAAALQTYDLATIVGTRTFGKGTFQEVIELPAGGALDLTIGEYLTADGSSIAGEGVKPDVRAEDDPRTRRDEALASALRVLAAEL